MMPVDSCVVCFHDGHPDGPCESLEDNWPPGVTPYPCGCREYVTEEERGRIIICPHGHNQRACWTCTPPSEGDA